MIRRLRPAIVLAPTSVENQHPDHPGSADWCATPPGSPATAASRSCADSPPHAIEQLFFYALSPEAEPRDITPMLIDVSAPEVIAAWTAAMEAHASQVQARATTSSCS